MPSSLVSNFFLQKPVGVLIILVDALYYKLHSEGIGCSVNQTETLTDKDEEKLWQPGVLDPFVSAN